MLPTLEKLDPTGVVVVSFNPTAENMAHYLLKTIGPLQLADTGITLVEVRVEETRKCTATASQSL
jgi:6-pyruvoyltetrahydropterin/6-carboxytetrahydropterin synthase